MAIEILEPSVKKYVFLAVICVLFSGFAFIVLGYGSLLLDVIFWSLVFITPLVMDFVPKLARHPGKMALQGMQGTHYTFDNARVRVFYSEQKVWLATKDIYSALNLPLSGADMRRLTDGKLHRLIPGTKIIGVSETNFASSLRHLRANEKERFIHWVERSVLLPIHNKAQQGIAISENVNS